MANLLPAGACTTFLLVNDGDRKRVKRPVPCLQGLIWRQSTLGLCGSGFKCWLSHHLALSLQASLSPPPSLGVLLQNWGITNPHSEYCFQAQRGCCMGGALGNRKSMHLLLSLAPCTSPLSGTPTLHGGLAKPSLLHSACLTTPNGQREFTGKGTASCPIYPKDSATRGCYLGATPHFQCK